LHAKVSAETGTSVEANIDPAIDEAEAMTGSETDTNTCSGPGFEA
jgi:hypothetical protein